MRCKYNRFCNLEVEVVGGKARKKDEEKCGLRLAAGRLGPANAQVYLAVVGG